MLPPTEDDIVHFLAGVGKYGILPAIALFLIWQMSSAVATKLDLTYEVTRQHNASAANSADRIQDSQFRMERMQGVLIDLARQTCVNAAKDYLQRQACFTAGSNR